MVVLSVISILGCATPPTTLVLDEATDDPGVTDDTGAAAETEDTMPPEPVPDTSVWDADLIFNYDPWGEDYDCVDEFVHETGEAPSVEELAGLQAECPACTEFYWAMPSEQEICGWIPLEPGLRGLVFGDGWAQVYLFEGTVEDGYSGSLLDSAATFDGWTVTFSGAMTIFFTDLLVSGTLTFPEE